MAILFPFASPLLVFKTSYLLPEELCASGLPKLPSGPLSSLSSCLASRRISERLQAIMRLMVDGENVDTNASMHGESHSVKMGFSQAKKQIRHSKSEKHSPKPKRIFQKVLQLPKLHPSMVVGGWYLVARTGPNSAFSKSRRSPRTNVRCSLGV